MARLDVSRIGAWRGSPSARRQIERGLDEELRADWDIPARLVRRARLAAAPGRDGARPLDVAADLRLPPSSLSRRLDRLQEEGWIARHREVPGADLRAVEIELTRTGRRLWREMNVSYRRALQAQFAIHLDDDDIADIARVARRQAVRHRRPGDEPGRRRDPW